MFHRCRSQCGIESHRCQPIPASGAGHGHIAPARGDGRDQHAQCGVLALQPFLERPRCAFDACTGGIHPVAIGAQTGDDPVVDHDAVFIEQQSITSLAGRQGRHRSHIHEIEKMRRVGAVDLELAERRAVEYSRRPAYRAGLPLRGGLQGFSLPWIGGRPHPIAELFEQRAARAVPLVRRKILQRADKQVADPPASQQAEGDRRKRRTELGGAHLGGLAPRELSHQHQRIDVAGLTLISAHSGGGVALQMLDRSIIFLRGEPDIADRHVVLQIYELFTPQSEHVSGGERPARAAHRSRRRRVAPGEREPQFRGVIERRVARENSGGGAGAPYSGRRPVGHKHGGLFHPA